ncbi:MAG: DUF465 domain-containing protein [Deltaproteobacteria bacterium]|nr:DUF465 domain-containing protein [Deltaproteobacteria bacterium]
MYSELITELEEKLQILKVEHRALDQRLVELEKHLSMTPEEHVEAARIKKQKLKKKDEMSAIESRLHELKEQGE